MGMAGAAGAKGAAPEEKKKGGLSAPAGFGLIVLMFLLGLGAAFGYHKVTTPKISSDLTPANTTPASSSASPAASPSPTGTPHTLLWIQV